MTATDAEAEITKVLSGVHGEGLVFRSIDSTTVAFLVPDGDR